MAEKDKVLFIGYGFNGEPGLDSLLRNGSFDITGVVTPPYETGRYRKELKDLPVERLAKDNNLDVIRTNKEGDIVDIIKYKEPENVLICVYNKIFSEDALKLARFYNIHHGDLPRWRGSSSTEWAIISGRNEITLTLHEVIPNLDSGDIWWQHKVSVNDDETITDMRRKMNDALRENLGNVFEKVLHNERHPELKDVYKREQKGTPTYTVRIQGIDAMIDWRKPAKEIYNLIRGLCDPELENAFTFYNNKKLDILEAKIVASDRIYEGHIPGKPVKRDEEGVEVLTGDPAVNIFIKKVKYRANITPAYKAITSTRDTLGIDLVDLLNRVEYLEDKD